MDINFLYFLLVSASGRLKECLKSALSQCHSAGLKHRQGRVGKQRISGTEWDGLGPLGTLLWFGREEKGQQDQKGSREQRLRAARSLGACVSIQLCCLTFDETSLKNILTTFQVVIVFQ